VRIDVQKLGAQLDELFYERVRNGVRNFSFILMRVFGDLLLSPFLTGFLAKHFIRKNYYRETIYVISQ
jgi:hypothetical protein